MRYCPVCGAEYVEGVTRCAEHDVDLVDEPPEPHETPSWLERIDHRRLMKIAVMLAGAALGAVGATYAWDHWIDHPLCADPPFSGRYQTLQCLTVPPPLWLNLAMVTAGIVLALGFHALLARWRAKRDPFT